MKIRSDYVSNSSSSSFIINFMDKGKCIDGRFIGLLKRTNHVCLSGDCGTRAECEKLRKKVMEAFGGKTDASLSKEETSIDVYIPSDSLDPNEPRQVEVIRELLKLKNGNCYCGCGEDWGDDLANAVQTATMLECLYKDIEIEGDDHLDYSSVRGTELDENS